MSYDQGLADALREIDTLRAELAAEGARTDALVFACKAFGLDASGHDSVPLLTKALAEIERSRVTPVPPGTRTKGEKT